MTTENMTDAEISNAIQARIQAQVDELVEKKGDKFAKCVQLLLKFRAIITNNSPLLKMIPGVSDYYDLALDAISVASEEFDGKELTAEADRIFELLEKEFDHA